MTEPLTSHYRDPETASEIVDATTDDQCTVLYERIRDGIRPVVIRRHAGYIDAMPVPSDARQRRYAVAEK